MRVPCETAAQCERLAAATEAIVPDAVTAAVVLVAVAQVGRVLWR